MTGLDKSCYPAFSVSPGQSLVKNFSGGSLIVVNINRYFAAVHILRAHKNFYS